MHGADLHAALTAGVGFLDQLAHPLVATHTERLERTAADLGQFGRVVESRSQRRFDLLRLRRNDVGQLSAQQDAPEAERGLAAHDRFRIGAQAEEERREIGAVVLPERLDRLRAHLHVVIEQAGEEDAREVELDVVIADVGESIDDRAAALDAEPAPHVEELLMRVAVDRAEADELFHRQRRIGVFEDR